jgi:hypothetical protein
MPAPPSERPSAPKPKPPSSVEHGPRSPGSLALPPARTQPSGLPPSAPHGLYTAAVPGARQGLRAVQSLPSTSAKVRSVEFWTTVAFVPLGRKVAFVNQLQPPETHEFAPAAGWKLPSCHGGGTCITPCERAEKPRASSIAV